MTFKTDQNLINSLNDVNEKKLKTLTKQLEKYASKTSVGKKVTTRQKKGRHALVGSDRRIKTSARQAAPTQIVAWPPWLPVCGQIE